MQLIGAHCRQRHLTWRRWLALALLCCAGCDSQTPRPAARPATAASLEFATDYQAAIRKAAETGRPVLVLFTCRDCPCCRYMLQHALREPVATGPAQGFLCVHVELEQDPQLCREFRVQSFPTLQFVSPDGVALRRVAGQLAAPEVASLLSGVQASLARRTIAHTPRPTRYTFGDRKGSLR